MSQAKVEEKLFQDRYRVDTGRPHIRIKNARVCLDHCQQKPCTVCCPAGCYTLDETDRVILITDGCLECGTCRIICDEYENIDWAWPRGGFGILFKFG